MNFPLKAQAQLNRWRREANKLPRPTMEGEWCIAPGGTRFRVVGGSVYLDCNLTHLWWELCTPRGEPLGMLFRETAVWGWWQGVGGTPREGVF